MDLDRVLLKIGASKLQLEKLKAEVSGKDQFVERLYRAKSKEVLSVRKTALLESKLKVQAHDRIEQMNRELTLIQGGVGEEHSPHADASG